ncbi:MAG: hypothetical protein QOE92_1876, partial [Chloroflexota bacterium]|nr:hypothetical protein [Chloroflexota bacterium]
LPPLALATTSIVGLAATAGYLLSRGDADRGRPLASAASAVALVLLLAGAGAALLLGAGGPRPFGEHNLVVTTHGARFSATELAASPGQVTIEVTNEDLFWHTLTIERLGVDIRVPVKAHRSATFDVTPGTYTYRCAIPGHESIGMRGTLTVR